MLKEEASSSIAFQSWNITQAIELLSVTARYGLGFMVNL
jgi:hypothetical protein